jgi:opacity protein-like surface antigen
MRRKLLLGSFLALALLVPVLAQPASAASVQKADPTGDGHGAGDIVSVRMQQAGEFILAQVRTAKGLIADEAPTWNSANSSTVLRFNFDNGNDGEIDYVVRVEASATGPQLFTSGIAHSPRSPCANSFVQPERTLLRVRIQQSCIGSPAQIRTFARYRLDLGANESIDSDDRAPNAGFTSTLTWNF